MKNVIKHLKKGILLVTMLTTIYSFANKSSFYSIKNDTKKTSLTLNNVKKGNILSIIDINGIILYKEVIENSGIYSKGFDLTYLPDGFYTFELDKDLEIKTIPFTVNYNNVVFNKKEEKTIFKPYTRVKDDFVYISKLALNNDPLKIEIYFLNDYDYELVYTEKVINTKNIEKTYKLTGLKKGDYKIVIETEGKTFTKNI
ncbi:MAG: hypothetical protein NWQ07_08055 [Flaviramulus sp.]|nr:hypothetical protein [Flaviramulus sp.]